MLDHDANGRAWQRVGNRPPWRRAAPQGAYPTEGEDRWIAIACFGENDWQGLVECLGNPSWADDPRFADLAGREAHADELDRLIAAGTRGREGFALMEVLQGRGVAAGICQTARDRIERDPQLRHSGWLVELPQDELGRISVKELPFDLNETPPWIGGRPGRAGPSYAEDNGYVLGNILGLGEGDIAQLLADGIIEPARGAKK